MLGHSHPNLGKTKTNFHEKHKDEITKDKLVKNLLLTSDGQHDFWYPGR